MALQSALVQAANARPGRLKLIAGDPIGGGSLSGVITPTGHTGWVLANGAALSNTGIYTTLYAMVGTKFGAAGTLPNLLDGRTPIPKGSINFPTVGAIGGEINHVLTSGEYASHTHTYADMDGNAGRGSNQANIDGFDPYNRKSVSRTTSSTGGGGSHNNMPPYLIVGFWLVKL